MKRNDEFDRAVSNGDLNKVLAMLRDKPDLGPRPPDNRTPLHMAVLWTQYDLIWPKPYDKIIEALLKVGADIDVRMTGGETPLMVASMKGHDELALILLKQGAAVHFEDKSGLTALSHALWKCYKNDSPLIKELLRNKSPINLWDALWLENTPLAISLVDRTDPRIIGPEGYTPLHLAALLGNLPVVERLLAQRANVKARADNKVTPPRLACGGVPETSYPLLSTWTSYGARADRKELVQMLLKAGASRTAEDKSYRTPRDWAKGLERPDLVELLKP